MNKVRWPIEKCVWGVLVGLFVAAVVSCQPALPSELVATTIERARFVNTSRQVLGRHYIDVVCDTETNIEYAIVLWTGYNSGGLAMTPLGTTCGKGSGNE